MTSRTQLPEGRVKLFRACLPSSLDPAECWEWGGYVDKDGYGVLSGKPQTSGHRASWLIHRGDLPDDLVLDHLCRNRKCVNPDHLEPVSIAENLRRQVKRGSCRKGHPYTPESMYVSRSGRRICRPCRNAAVQRYAARRGPRVRPE
jgi:hypothetical protein